MHGSPYWPYYFPIGVPGSDVARALGEGGVGRELRDLQNYLQSLGESGAVVRRSGIKGYEVAVGDRPLSGVFAVYAGVLTTSKEADPLSDAQFQFSSDMGRFSKMCIDAAVLREEGPAWGAGLLNHKCVDWNACCRVRWYDGRPVLVFETIGLVGPHVELTWNYNGTSDSGYYLSPQALARQQRFWPVELCKCGPDGVCPLKRGRVTTSARHIAAGAHGGRTKRAPEIKMPLKREGGRIQQQPPEDPPKEQLAPPAWPYNMSQNQRAIMRSIVRSAELSRIKRAPEKLRDLKRDRKAISRDEEESYLAKRRKPNEAARLAEKAWAKLAPGEQGAEDELVFDSEPGGKERVAQSTRNGVKLRTLHVVGDRDLVQWGKTNYPTIANRWDLCKHPSIRGLPAKFRRILLNDASKRSPLERGTNTHMLGISRRDGRDISFEQLGDINKQVFEPTSLAGGTRDGYEVAARKVFTFFFSHNKIANALPMSVDDFKRLITEMALAGESIASMRTVGAAVAQMHKQAGATSPTEGGGGLNQILKPYAIAQGTPRAVAMPITPGHVQQMLDLRIPPANNVMRRAVLVAAMGTVMAGRNQHVADRTVCDLIEDYDVERDASTKGSFAVCIPNQKQDREGRGTLARIGAGKLANGLKRWMKDQKLHKSRDCQKRVKGANPLCKCIYCPPLFPSRADALPEPNGSIKPISRQQVSDCVKMAMLAIGVDERHVSGRSMRRGGMTAARKSKVPEDVVYATSGHGMRRAGRLYIGDHSIDELYAVSKACEGQ